MAVVTFVVSLSFKKLVPGCKDQLVALQGPVFNVKGLGSWLEVTDLQMLTEMWYDTGFLNLIGQEGERSTGLCQAW